MDNVNAHSNKLLLKFSKTRYFHFAALAHLQDYKSALQSIEKAVELKPSLPSAHENLVKLTLNAESRYTNFVDFWNASHRRITIAIIVCVSIAIMVGYSFLVGGDRSLEVQETIDNNGIRNVTSTTRTGFAIPETTIIVIGILVFILLIPEIRKAKVGPIEFEMSPREVIPLDPSIDYVDNPLYIIL